MAYLDLSQDLLLPPAHAVPPAPTRMRDRGIGGAERNVLFLSRRDSRASVADRHSAARRIRRLFGLEGPNLLAEPRLEALRRFAVLLRHDGDRLAVDEDVRLRMAGYTSGDMAEVRRIIGRDTPGTKATPAHRRLVAGCVVAILTAQLLLYRFLAAYLDDGLLGLIGTAVATAAAIPPARLLGNVLMTSRARPAATR